MKNDQVITSRTPSFEDAIIEVSTAQAQMRMLMSYIQEHIDISSETGPNRGQAQPDMMYQCFSIVGALDRVMENIDSLAIESRKMVPAPVSKVDQQLQ